MTVYVDRIEGEFAVVECGGTSFDVPLALLPEGVEEGWALRWQIERDEGAEAERRAAASGRMSRLMEDDDGGDFAL